MSDQSIISELILALPEAPAYHAPNCRWYELLKRIARRDIEDLFSDKKMNPKAFGPFGSIVFPYHSMGAIDSLDLFGLDELIIFSFYWLNRERYKNVVDIGANIGVHSILMCKCGFHVRSYEPDPKHFDVLDSNLRANDCAKVETFNAAVSKAAGEMEFVRVLGNTTGSHLAGSKDNPYGDLERFPVKVEAIADLIDWADFLKIDAEGHEWEILSVTTSSQWRHCDAIIEIGNERNAGLIFDHLSALGANLFSQKTGWAQVRSIQDMPTSYRDGSLFVSCKPRMPWCK